MAVSEGTERPGVMEWVKRRLIKNPGMLSAPSDVYGAVKGAGYAAQAMAPVAERAVPDAVTKYAGLASIPFVGPFVAAGEAIRANLPGESRERFNPGTDERTAPMNPGTYEPDATGRELPGGYGMKPTATVTRASGYDRRAADEERALLQRRVILANQNAGRGFDPAQTEDMRQHALALSQGISAYDAGRARGGSAPVMNAAQAHADKLLGAYQTQRDQRVAEANMERELIKAQGERAIREARFGTPDEMLARQRAALEAKKLAAEGMAVDEFTRTGLQPDQAMGVQASVGGPFTEFMRDPGHADQILTNSIPGLEASVLQLGALPPEQAAAMAQSVLRNLPTPEQLDARIAAHASASDIKNPAMRGVLAVGGARQLLEGSRALHAGEQTESLNRLKATIQKLRAMAGAMPAEARQR